jgi:protoporphyrinogen oxidase
VIVGGGISGLAAAYANRNSDYLLLELSDRIGGTSAAASHDKAMMCQGAHYELAYPEYYGEEVLKMLEELKIIQFEPWKKHWSFVDKQHIIPYQRRQQCYFNGKIQSDVLPVGEEKELFLELISDYSGKMPLPSRLSKETERKLNDLTFSQYLDQHITLSSQFKRGLDYHMMDDYGAGINEVSAFSGIHYFMCRPYYRQTVDLFSPPQGNYYFIDKIQNRLSSSRIKTQHLVRSITKHDAQYVLQVIDLENKGILEIQTQKVIYAGQKHALKYIYPEQDSLFNNVYAPWMVVNLVCKKEISNYGFWQNEFIGENPSFLGFVDSSVQHADNPYRIFTAYYCFDPQSRDYLTTIEAHKEKVAGETQSYIEEMLGTKISPEAAYVNLMGHAMPVPKPGYLFKDANYNPDAQLIYAGVDNGRLPLLFEALDSGLMTRQFV